jgi:AcrR family transcriptional regulator
VKPQTRARAARADRRDRIVSAARDIAETDGWGAVTVRRLADAIGFSQPVLYGHFPDGRDGIVRAVALDGFARVAAVLSPPPPDPSSASAEVRPTTESSTRSARLRQVAENYLDFARTNAAVYEAMFSLPTDLAFATEATPAELLAAFAALLEAAGGDETRAETLWSALHGLAELSRRARLRPGHDAERVEVVVELFSER